MAFMRKNVWELGSDWADPILWYARGVAAMKALPIADSTSWRFYGAIHGIDPPLWQALGYLDTSELLPSPALQRTYWKQCQHGSWYFLPWHRGYLLAFEAIVRAHVVKLGGPADWALPYWNYFKTNQAALPPAFASPDWPDGKGNNPLFVPERWGPKNDRNVFVPLNAVNLKAMNDPDFTGLASGGSPGFGGVDTGFAHSGRVHGRIESQPHDMVHGLVGGQDPEPPRLPGLMSDPDTAGLDPIFWLHHANIDRLWAVWLQNPPTHLDPAEANWKKGPVSIGERAFVMPKPDGSAWTYTPNDMTDLPALGYEYDDLSPAVAVFTLADRLLRLGRPAAEVQPTEGAGSVAAPKKVELVGANTGAVPIQGTEARTAVALEPAPLGNVAASLRAAAPAAPPDRVFLNLENVRGKSDATAFHVYVGLPEGADPADHPELLAGSVGLFGVRKASEADGEHGGQGLTYVLDITDIVDRLHLQNALAAGTLGVRIVPVNPVPASDQVSIGRISVFRQGQ